MKKAGCIKKYAYSEAEVDGTNQPASQKLRIQYHNWDTATAAIVISHEVDKQEVQQFLEQFKIDVETQVLGKKGGAYENPMNASSSYSEDTQLLYKPFQANNAETAFWNYSSKLD